MKLVSYRLDQEVRLGAVSAAGELLDLQRLVPEEPLLQGSMVQLIEGGPALLARLQSAVAAATAAAVVTGDVTWLPPVRPGKICGVALNNSASNSRKISAPEHPAFFLKPPSCVLGHGQEIRIRPYYGSVHPEPELCLVMGSRTRDVDARQALDKVFGYAIFNDITSNGMRAEDLFHYQAIYSTPDGGVEYREQHLSYAGRYKGTDGFGVLGPWLVTRDEIPCPDELSVRCWVAGELVAEDSTRYYNYQVAEIVSFISQFHTLEPGDIISCGTAFRPSAQRKSIHHANFQVTGGPVVVEVEGLGRQENPVVLETKEMGQWRLKP